MVSFDVISLFTMVPVDLTLDFLQTDLINFDLPFSISTTIRLIKLCVEGTTFSFESGFYVQNSGFQMGGVLPTLFSNYFMEKFESSMASHLICLALIWRRYVDDIFSIRISSISVALILRALNQLLTDIQFTIEQESNGQLPFLDVLVCKTTPRLTFKVHRKETNNKYIIPFTSAHSDSIKRMALTSMYLRALRLVSPQHLHDEFLQIKNISEKNGYPARFTLDCAERSRKSFYATAPRPPFDKRKIICLPYSSQFENIKSPLLKLGYQLVFKWTNTLAQFMIKNSPPQPQWLSLQNLV